MKNFNFFRIVSCALLGAFFAIPIFAKNESRQAEVNPLNLNFPDVENTGEAVIPGKLVAQFGGSMDGFIKGIQSKIESDRGQNSMAPIGGSGDSDKYSTTPGNPSCRFFDGFVDNGDGTVVDSRSGLIWQRCAFGQSWSNGSCKGVPKSVNWFDAMEHAGKSRFQDKSDWRLPSKLEISQTFGGNCFNRTGHAVSRVLISDEINIWAYTSDDFYSKASFCQGICPPLDKTSFRWFGSATSGFYDHRGKRDIIHTSKHPLDAGFAQFVRNGSGSTEMREFVNALKFSVANGDKLASDARRDEEDAERRKQEFRERWARGETIFQGNGGNSASLESGEGVLYFKCIKIKAMLQFGLGLRGKLL